MAKNIELRVKDVTLSAAQAPGKKYAPFIKVNIAELSDEQRELMILAEDMEDHRHLPPYYMRDIQLDEDNPLVATVVARIGSEYFDEEPDDGQEPNPLFQDVELRLPMPFLMMSYALSNAPDGGMVMIVTRLDEADTDNAHISSYADFALTMPPENSLTYDHLVEKMETVFVPSFAQPIATEAFTDSHDEKVPREARIAQYLLFSIYEGLAKGNKFALGRVLQLVASIDEHISPDSDSEHEHVPYFSYVATIAAEAYRRSRINTRSLDAPSVEMSEDGDSEDGSLDQAFADIINGSELMELLDDVPNAGIPESNPFDNGFPESMKSLEELFQEGNVAAHLAPVIYRDGVTSHTASEIIDNYSIGLYVAGIIIVTAARAAHLVSERKTEEDEKVAYISSRWISFDEDPHLWELPALSVSIADYDMETFTDLLQYGDQQDIGGMPYLYSVLHELGTRMYEEKWTVDNLEARLSMMDITLPHMEDVKEALLTAIVSAEDDGDNEMCPGCMTVITVAETTESIEDTAQSVSLAIPALADLNAAEHGLEVGSEEWRKFRIHYISDFMREATARGE